MNFKQFLSEGKGPRIKVTRIDEEITVTPLDDDEGKSSDDFDTEIKDNEESGDRKSPIQKALTALNDLDDYFQGNGGQDPEFGDLSDEVQKLRDRLKGKLESCKAPEPEKGASSADGSGETTLEITA
jgi:hypothetical protein